MKLLTEAEGSVGDGRYQVRWKRAKDLGAAGWAAEASGGVISKAHVVRW